jgi:hypothetical protein
LQKPVFFAKLSQISSGPAEGTRPSSDFEPQQRAHSPQLAAGIFNAFMQPYLRDYAEVGCVPFAAVSPKGHEGIRL